jgi:hypothetical protein
MSLNVLFDPGKFFETKGEHFKNVEEVTPTNPTTQKNKAALHDSAHKWTKPHTCCMNIQDSNLYGEFTLIGLEIFTL